MTRDESDARQKTRGVKRRHFATEEKLAILAEAAQGNESLSSVGRRYGIAVALLFRWKRALAPQLEKARQPRSACGFVAPPSGLFEPNLRSRVETLEANVGWLWAENRRLREHVRQLESAQHGALDPASEAPLANPLTRHQTT